MVKTFTDKLIPYYVWFIYGFGIISILIGITNFGMIMITLITVKGIYVPTWMLPAVAILLISLCIFIGYYFEKYAIWKRINSHQNQNMNPEMKQLSDDVKEIKKILKGEI